MGLYFAFRTKFVQIRLLGESIRLVTEKKGNSNSVSAFEALMVSTAGRVSTAPNAAAAADVSHPVKQGLVQMLSVFIDTILICTATAMMCLSSGITPSEELKGAVFVQTALSKNFGNFGFYFVTFALLLFAFTTLLGNLFYCEGCLNYIANRTVSNKTMTVFRLAACVVVFSVLFWILVWCGIFRMF